VVQNEALKTLLFLLVMVLVTVIPGALIIGGVTVIKAWMTRKRRASSAKEVADRSAPEAPRTESGQA
jgi:hypothetical protein